MLFTFTIILINIGIITCVRKLIKMNSTFSHTCTYSDGYQHINKINNKLLNSDQIN